MAAECPCCPWEPCDNVRKRMQDKLKEEEEKKEKREKKEKEEDKESARVEALWLGREIRMEARMEEIEEKQREITNLFNHFHLL